MVDLYNEYSNNPTLMKYVDVCIGNEEDAEKAKQKMEQAAESGMAYFSENRSQYTKKCFSNHIPCRSSRFTFNSFYIKTFSFSRNDTHKNPLS